MGSTASLETSLDSDDFTFLRFTVRELSSDLSADDALVDRGIWILGRFSIREELAYALLVDNQRSTDTRTGSAMLPTGFSIGNDFFRMHFATSRANFLGYRSEKVDLAMLCPCTWVVPSICW
eukprot:s2127_g17.t1